MTLKRIMGTETEYGITGGHASDVVAAHHRKGKKHVNLAKTNESAVHGMHDVGGHIGGDYGSIEEQMRESGVSTQYSGKHSKHKHVAVRGATYDIPDHVMHNGARFYVDMGHPEYCTPETSNPLDLVIADKAGERIVQEAAEKVNGVKIYKNNSDGQGNSYGCHENYLMCRISSGEFANTLTPGILPFFVTRQIFSGSGKIGIEEPEHFSSGWTGESWSLFGGKKKPRTMSWRSYERQRDRILEEMDSVSRYFAEISEFDEVQKLLAEAFKKRDALGEPFIYQLSQRADFFEQTIGLGTTHDRPIVNTRDEPHADRSKYMRFHVICGDANMCEFATYLKTGTTALLLDLIEDGLLPEIDLKNPVSAIKNISGDQTRKWNVSLAKDKLSSAVEIQAAYLRIAEQVYRGRDEATDQILARWNSTLEALASDPMKLVGKVDWVTKLHLLNHLSARKGVPLNHEVIKNAALQYHDTNRSESLFYFLQNRGLVERLVTDEEIEHAMHHPPRDTRAFLRAKASSLPYVSSVDWAGFSVRAGKQNYEVKLIEPFGGTEDKVGIILESNPSAPEFLRKLKGHEDVEVTRKTFWDSDKSSPSSGNNLGKQQWYLRSETPLNPILSQPPQTHSPSWEENYGSSVPIDIPDQLQGGNTHGSE